MQNVLNSKCFKIIQKIQRKQYQSLLNELHKLQNPSSKYSRININLQNENNMNQFVEKRMKQIQSLKDVETSKYFNNINYKLYTDADLQYHTGFTSAELLQQAKMCKVSDEIIFHCRYRLKHYLPMANHERQYGMAHGSLQKHVNTGWEALEKYYAEPVLINSGPEDKQYWTRQKIKQHTPTFVYQIQGYFVSTL